MFSREKNNMEKVVLCSIFLCVLVANGLVVQNNDIQNKIAVNETRAFDKNDTNITAEERISEVSEKWSSEEYASALTASNFDQNGKEIFGSKIDPNKEPWKGLIMEMVPEVTTPKVGTTKAPTLTVKKVEVPYQRKKEGKPLETYSYQRIEIPKIIDSPNNSEVPKTTEVVKPYTLEKKIIVPVKVYVRVPVPVPQPYPVYKYVNYPSDAYLGKKGYAVTNLEGSVTEPYVVESRIQKDHHDSSKDPHNFHEESHNSLSSWTSPFKDFSSYPSSLRDTHASFTIPRKKVPYSTVIARQSMENFRMEKRKADMENALAYQRFLTRKNNGPMNARRRIHMNKEVPFRKTRADFSHAATPVAPYSLPRQPVHNFNLDTNSLQSNKFNFGNDYNLKHIQNANYKNSHGNILYTKASNALNSGGHSFLDYTKIITPSFDNNLYQTNGLQHTNGLHINHISPLNHHGISPSSDFEALKAQRMHNLNLDQYHPKVKSNDFMKSYWQVKYETSIPYPEKDNAPYQFKNNVINHIYKGYENNPNANYQDAQNTQQFNTQEYHLLNSPNYQLLQDHVGDIIHGTKLNQYPEYPKNINDYSQHQYKHLKWS